MKILRVGPISHSFSNYLQNITFITEQSKTAINNAVLIKTYAHSFLQFRSVPFKVVTSLYSFYAVSCVFETTHLLSSASILV